MSHYDSQSVILTQLSSKPLEMEEHILKLQLYSVCQPVQQSRGSNWNMWNTKTSDMHLYSVMASSYSM